MKQLVTKAIVLSRTDFGEADRIITLLTPEQGKLRLMARGVRKAKSKVAGGIELFSVSDITHIPGKGEIGTLVSARLDRHYGNIVKNIDRVQLGYELIKVLHKTTEDSPEQEYFYLLASAFDALDDATIATELIRAWYEAQLITFAGHGPNLQTEADGQKLQADAAYNFDFDNMAFMSHPHGQFGADTIKALRLLFSDNQPAQLQRVQGMDGMLPRLTPLMRTLATTYLRGA